MPVRRQRRATLRPGVEAVSSRALARRSAPELFTLYSGDVRIDVLVGSPDVMVIDRYVRGPFEPVRPPRKFDPEHLAMRYPFRVRLSWASDPERVLEMDRGNFLFESFSVPESAPTDHVFEVAQRSIDEWVQRDQRGRTKLVDYDRPSQGVNVSWEPPSERHVLAGSRRRLPGQAAPPAVLLRIRLLLDQADRSSGFEAESAYDRAEQLARSYDVDMQTIRAITRPGTGPRVPTSGDRRLIGRQLPPRRDVVRVRPRRGSRMAYPQGG